jgi:hypothetical protein
VQVKEPFVLEMDPTSFERAAPVLPECDRLSGVLSASFIELIDSMHDVRVAAVLEDLELYERTGRMSWLIEDTIRRAQCLAEADRIIATF